MTTASPQSFSARAQVADRHGRFLQAPPPGTILIVDAPDLDFEAAHTLLSYNPRAVLNAAKGSTGRALATGTAALLDRGVTVIDDLGNDILDVRDGAVLDITDADVSTKEGLLASGRRVSTRDANEDATGVQERLVSKVGAYALSASRDFASEQPLIVDGVGLPSSRVKMEGRIVLIATPTSDLTAQKTPLRQFVGDHNPVIIAVGTGANALAQVGLKPTVLVGDPRDVEARLLKKVRQVVVPSTDEVVPAREMLKRHSVDFDAVLTGLSGTDVAMLFAASNGAAAVVDCSAPRTLTQFIDRSGLETTGSVLVAAQLRDRLLSLDALLTVYRPRLSGWWLALLLVAALAAAVAAFLFTPLGSGLFGVAGAGVLPMLGRSFLSPRVMAGLHGRDSQPQTTKVTARKVRS